ncbi:hypothetical protein AYM39_22295 (plasmid) [Methylomonas sp. DH-1]|nr:hypothetical protein AYM39_22295 [Methylomonas sp. DH-1]
MESWFQDQKFQHVKMRIREVSGVDPLDPNDDYHIKYDFDFDADNALAASVNIFISKDSYVGLYIKNALGFQAKVLSTRAILAILKIISDGNVFYKNPALKLKYLFKPKLFIKKTTYKFLVENDFPYLDVFLIFDDDQELSNIQKYEPWS